MIINHLKIAMRSLKKNKIYSLINIIGLSVGIAAALLIFRIVNYETSFNKNFSNYDEIVRVIRLSQPAGQEEEYGVGIPTPAMDVVENTIPQFNKMTRIRELWATLSVPGETENRPARKFAIDQEDVAFFVENEFFDIFNLDWLAGDQATALKNPGTIMLSQSWAEKCFDSWENAIGKVVLIDNLFPVTVEGVYVDLPSNCDFPLQFLVSYETVRSNKDYFFYSDEWGSTSSNDQVFALLQKDANITEVDAALAKVGAKEYSENNNGVQDKFHLTQPLSELHYNEDLGHSGSHQISKSRINILSMIGVLILLMACFNFVNLATAQSSLRAKEVGVRKTLGGQRSQLISQFMMETGLIVFVALLLSAVITSVCVPYLEAVSNVPENIPFLTDPVVLGFLGITFLVVTLLSGAYPSLLLSAYKPIVALRSNVKSSTSGGNGLRKSLVVFQFAIAQALIIGAAVTILQMDYIQSKDLGFKKDLVFNFSFNSDSSSISKQAALKQQLKQIPTVESVTFGSDQPLSNNTWASNFRFADRPEDEPYSVTLKFGDADFAETYGIELLAGNWYPPSDTMRDAVINATLLHKLGLENAEEAIGQRIRMGGRRWLNIVAVAKDFHTHTFRSEHQPLLITTRKEFHWDAGLKIRPDNISATVASIEKIYDQVFPEQVFTGRFLDQQIALYYESDDRISNTSKAFGFLAILISCLGLFGLATHSASQRIKEIGIRKVLGANVFGIVKLLSRDFLLLVLGALLIAVPLAYYTMSQWLNNFIYRIELHWWIFILAGFITILIAFVTVSYQSIKAALANPVNSLKSE